ncbi:MAG: tetratricopeptide repeat protein, partial [Acidobacteria bacterium]|nr:tetratricopeptide repeat protein [Acidobacteriota bacterium]
DAALATALHAERFRIHMESNGTRSLDAPVDWLTVSPKPQFHPASISLVDELPISELEVARVWYERGRIHLELGECSEARRWAKKAAEGFECFGDQRRKNRSMYMVAGSYFNEGSMRAAADAFLALLDVFEDDHDEVSVACVSSALGHIFVREGRTSEALAMFRRAISIFRNRGMSVDAMRAEWGLARILIAENDFEAAVEKLRKLIQQFLSLKLVEEASLVRLDLYEALLLLDRRNEAEAEVRESLSVLSGRFSQREQQRALAYLREISELRQPRPEWVREVSDFLDLSRLNPGLEFTRGANRTEGGRLPRGPGGISSSLVSS